MNDFANLNNLGLRAKVSEITETLIDDHAQYGVPEAIVDLLVSLNEAYSESIMVAVAAEANSRAMAAAKNALRDEVLETLRQVSRYVYADPDVDNALLNKAGFSPRPEFGRRTSPKEVTDLVAEAHSNGSVTLKWNRSGNSRSALFKVWAKGLAGPWVNVGATTKLKITLENFTPGVSKVFYVTATVNNQTSLASTYASIYGGWEAKGPSVAA
ncbi:MAG: fibronectin type III domain-containing protein [Chthonomonas sp.]|nr:fibronectin type III domain-containing protein [Chthonomonas sp.]